MRVKRFKCEIVKWKGTYVILPKNKILRFFNILPIETATRKIINCACDWNTYKEAKWAYNNMMKEDYVEI